MTDLLARTRDRALGADPTAVARVRLRQRGEMRLAPGRPWLPFEAEQVLDARRPAFCWTARVRLAPGLGLRVVDALEGDRGRLDVRLWGWLPLARARGPDVDQGEQQRYLAELPWCPHAYASNPAIDFAEGPDRTLVASLVSSAGAAAVRLTVDDRGDVVEAWADDRPRRVGNEARPTAWRGRFRDHEALGGLRVPTRATVAWLLDDGPFDYWRGTVTALETRSA